MMNNCQKCGNPLQPGQTTCPICGTNIQEETTSQGTLGVNTNPLENIAPPKEELQSNPIMTSSESFMEASAPKVNPIQSGLVTETNSMATTNQVGEINQVQPTPGVISPTIMPQSATPSVQETPSSQTSLEILAPTITAPPLTSPVPSMPAGEPIINTTLQPVEPKKKKGKFSKMQKGIILGTLVLVLIAVIGVVMSSKSMTLPPNENANTNNTDAQGELPQDTTKVAFKEAVTNGYKLKYEEGWIIEEDSYNVLMKKNDESIVIKLEHFFYNLDDFDQEVIESYLAQREGISNPIVEKTAINGKNAYFMSYNVVTQNSTTYPVESYFINGGSNLVLGATIVYQSDTIKQANTNSVLSLMENVSYEDESIKALDSINMYYNAFSLYADIIGNSKKEKPVINENLEDENQNPEEEQNTEEQNGEVENNISENTQNTPITETPEMN